MIQSKTTVHQREATRHHQTRRLRAAVTYVTQGMRDLEEQLPLPADRRVRDTTSAQQKTRALRFDIEDFNLRLTQFSQQIKAINRIRE